MTSKLISSEKHCLFYANIYKILKEKINKMFLYSFSYFFFNERTGSSHYYYHLFSNLIHILNSSYLPLCSITLRRIGVVESTSFSFRCKLLKSLLMISTLITENKCLHYFAKILINMCYEMHICSEVFLVES